LMHLLVSGTRVRDAATGAIGEGPYMGLFSLASVAILTWMILAFGAAHRAAANAVLWSASPLTRDIQMVLQLLAFLLVVPGLATPNPTSVRQEGVLERPDAIKGMVRITRHPFLWGVAIWAADHLLVNGDVAGILLFGTMLLLALFGTASIDAKRRRALGPAWDAFAARTSSVPFAAILAHRQRLDLGEIGWWRPALAIALYVAVLFGHPYAFGVRALP
ncbi:MAG TPA: NnrU family protein, partial [Caulobacteraceae bacterium]|nr:NnrU family protein [Caulobacteraceae bacterium]